MALYRRTRNTRLLVVTLTMISLLIITIDFRGGQSGPFAAAGRGALSVIAPLQATVSRVVRPIGAFFSSIVRAGSLQEENRRLRVQIDELKRENLSHLSEQRAFRELSELLGLKRQLGLEGPTARVIGQSVDNFEWSVTIDIGSSSGVQLNMPVVTGDGLVGTVVQVTGSSSKVQLIIDPDSAIAARLVESGETGLIVGRRDGPLKMDLVSDESNVQPNEQVVTSGYQSGLYPPNIVIGFVSRVYTDPGQLAKVVEVRPAVDFSALEFVLVVTGR